MPNRRGALQDRAAACHLFCPCPRSVEKALQLDVSGSSELLEQLLPAKSGDLELAKLAAPSRLVIYLLDGMPILLDTSGKSDFIPTVMGLWSCPQLLPVVTLKHPAVSQFILSGRQQTAPQLSSVADLRALSTAWAEHVGM